MKTLKYLFFALVFISCSTQVKIQKQTIDNSRPKTPIMGWASWNNFRAEINEGIIKSQTDAMISTGLNKAGYNFVNIDDGFYGGRDANGNLLVHPERFPSGMKSLAKYIHSKGLNAGIYSDAGINTCLLYTSRCV